MGNNATKKDAQGVKENFGKLKGGNILLKSEILVDICEWDS